MRLGHHSNRRLEASVLAEYSYIIVIVPLNAPPLLYWYQ